MVEQTAQPALQRSLYDLIVEQPDRRPMRRAVVIALIVHVVLFIVRFPQLVAPLEAPTIIRIDQIRPLAQRSKPEGARPKQEVTPPKASVPQPKPVFMPVPDLTPDDPEPVWQEPEERIPNLKAQLSTELSLGDIFSPSAGGGSGSGPQVSGPGGGSGGDGVYQVGAGVSAPVLLGDGMVRFTDEAIQNRISGVVLLHGVVRRNGRADSLKLLRGLGYGLDEAALEAVANEWRFRPAMKDGQPVDCYITIEVQFTLY